MKNVTKINICSRIWDKRKGDVPVTIIKDIFENILDEILGTLAKGDRIEIRGFGSFRVKTRRPKKGRNPRTGEIVPVPQHDVPSFKFSKDAQKIFDERRKNL